MKKKKIVRGRIANRFPQTLSQLEVLKLLVNGEWTLLDRHYGKAAGSLTRIGTGEKPLVESRYDNDLNRSHYRITEEGRKALLRVTRIAS